MDTPIIVDGEEYYIAERLVNFSLLLAEYQKVKPASIPIFLGSRGIPWTVQNDPVAFYLLFKTQEDLLAFGIKWGYQRVYR